MYGRRLRVILLPDGETVHNAFFDRSFDFLRANGGIWLASEVKLEARGDFPCAKMGCKR